METLVNSVTTATPEKRKNAGGIQVLQVHETALMDDQEDSLHEGIYICHATLIKALRQIWVHNKQIDAVLVGPEYSASDIVSIREITNKKSVPLFLHTLKFDWNAKEFALETGVDEYHFGGLDHAFIRRVELIKRVTSFKHLERSGQRLMEQHDGSPSVKVWFLKRIFDITISLLIVLTMFPVILVIMLILKLEMKRSVFCRSKRVGKNFKIFSLYQFRGMASAEDEDQSVGISPFGQFLHRSHLGGLPQIINILAGDMSIVGNCPMLVRDAEKLTKDEIAWRFLVPAGVVGLWQFGHLSENKMGTGEGTRLDLEYALTSSIWLDIRILYRRMRNLAAAKQKRKAWIIQTPTMEMVHG